MDRTGGVGVWGRGKIKSFSFPRLNPVQGQSVPCFGNRTYCGRTGRKGRLALVGTAVFCALVIGLAFVSTDFIEIKGNPVRLMVRLVVVLMFCERKVPQGGEPAIWI